MLLNDRDFVDKNMLLNVVLDPDDAPRSKVETSLLWRYSRFDILCKVFSSVASLKRSSGT